MSAIDEEMRAQREAMVREVEQSAASLTSELGRGALSPRVLAALRAVPRDLFVPPEHISDAYRNRPVPIGYGQTISQPMIVALMTDILDLKPGDKVLDVGTGSGYQAAVLAQLVDIVHTIELCAPLAERAARTFKALGLGNIHTRIGDGHLGWPEAAPFDAILVAAAAAEVPEALIQQLAPGRRLLMSVGGTAQQLILVEKRSDQSTVLREIIPVCFVPMTRQGTPKD
ncbi:protein-L-isoaspartate(D-aspartate) O-methyltransferase [Hyphomicrobium sp.]|uniref:protein-L-isoaspartate(D-aspartate) O-methyltransferase n=1 Tax=Hyphomicrobium sp. TaxID=82 RepID=UPI0025BAE8B6|nr:protein-L-isoaspartate(D-aspartate) O-methyltransferase [Hyphomicrobium sp.]MCC7250711.1 protein-L-isoaspartate(D-aspartate) O-methyltransferase [Hyphomicrobium sp.]